MNKCTDCEGKGYVEVICLACHGSGEGMHADTTCQACKGTGEVVEECETCYGEGEVESD